MPNTRAGAWAAMIRRGVPAIAVVMGLRFFTNKARDGYVGMVQSSGVGQFPGLFLAGRRRILDIFHYYRFIDALCAMA